MTDHLMWKFVRHYLTDHFRWKSVRHYILRMFLREMIGHLLWKFITIYYMIDHLRWKFIRDTWFNYRSNRIGGLDRRSLRRTVTGGLATSTRGASRGVVRSRPGVSHKSVVGGDDGSSRLWSTKEPRLRRMSVLPSVRTW